MSIFLFESKIMEEKNKLPIEIISNEKNHFIIRLYSEFCYLKSLYRQGWLNFKISKDKCESVAEHCFSVAVLCMFIAENNFPEYDLLKIIKMALIHDFGEIYLGDITPNDNISLKEKREKEEEAIKKIFSKLANKDDYINLWQDFEYGKSKEALFVKEIDKLEMILQASLYEKQCEKNLEEFFKNNKISNNELKNILENIKTFRKD